MDDTGPATSPVTIRRDGKVAIIHLDDGKANALGHAAIAALLAAFDEVEASDADAVVLVGRPG
jgi:enoyl-CoA hydratase/carnithine racemase